MQKILKAVAPIILVIFTSSALAAPAFGANEDKIEDVQVSMTLYSYDLAAKQPGKKIETAFAGEPFLLDLKVQGKGSQINDVNALQSSFTYIDSYEEQGSSPWVHSKAFILRAPVATGTYNIPFQCTDKFYNSVQVSVNIEVVAGYQPPPVAPATSEIVMPGPVISNPTGGSAQFEARPVHDAVVMPAAKKAPPASDARSSSHSTTTTVFSTHMMMSGVSGDFWWGFLFGVLVAAIVYSSGTERAVK